MFLEELHSWVRCIFISHNFLLVISDAIVFIVKFCASAQIIWHPAVLLELLGR